MITLTKQKQTDRQKTEIATLYREIKEIGESIIVKGNHGKLEFNETILSSLKFIGKFNN